MKDKEKRSYFKKIGKLVKDLRYKHELTQEKFAEIVDCNISTVQCIEHATGSVSVWMLVRIAKAFNLSPKDLLPEFETNDN